MTKNKMKQLLKTDSKKFQPGISVDCVIIGFHEGTLKVLLNRFRGYNKWMLPGGFILHTENVDDSAYRILSSRTSLKDIYLKQFHFFGDANRTKLDENEELLKLQGYTTPEEIEQHWLMQRFVSAGYYALVEYSKVKVSANPEEEIEWFEIHNLPELYSDHQHIIDTAILSIRKQINYTPIGYELLPEKFTLTELRLIYETILDKKLDRRNFQRKILSLGYICKLDETQKKLGFKETSMYSFDKDKYMNALDNNLTFQ